jgi:hypothetical protein
MATREREFVYRDGKPAAVILDITEYEELLERAEDLDDLRALKRMRARPLRFRSLTDVLAQSSPPSGSDLAVHDAPPSSRVSRSSRSRR